MALTVKKLLYRGVVVSVFWTDALGDHSIALVTGTDQEILTRLGADTVILPADPEPKVYALSQLIDGQRVRTTNATTTDIFRATVPPNTAYKALLTIWGITDDLANLRMIEATVVVGRAGTGAAIIQTRVSPANATIEADHAIGTGGIWALPTIAVSGNDVIIRVTGPASPAVNWQLTGSFETFTPGGA
jgi:hypothetical protein